MIGIPPARLMVVPKNTHGIRSSSRISRCTACCTAPATGRRGTMNATSQRTLATKWGKDTKQWVNKVATLFTQDMNVRGTVRKVIFEMDDGNLVIEDPSVLRIKMQGQTTFQVSGEAVEEETESFSEDDIQMVMSSSGNTEDEARAALSESEGDIAEAIMALKG